jgi:hypothetical protein
MSVRLVSLRGMPPIPELSDNLVTSCLGSEVSPQSEGTKLNQTSLRLAEFFKLSIEGEVESHIAKADTSLLIYTLLDCLGLLLQYRRAA